MLPSHFKSYPCIFFSPLKRFCFQGEFLEWLLCWFHFSTIIITLNKPDPCCSQNLRTPPLPFPVALHTWHRVSHGYRPVVSFWVTGWACSIAGNWVLAPRAAHGGLHPLMAGKQGPRGMQLCSSGWAWWDLGLLRHPLCPSVCPQLGKWLCQGLGCVVKPEKLHSKRLGKSLVLESCLGALAVEVVFQPEASHQGNRWCLLHVT